MLTLIHRFASSPHAARAVLQEKLSRDHARILTIFGERMATCAVRSKSEVPLRDGLIALALAVGKDDDREVLAVLPLYGDASRHLGVDLSAPVADTASLIGGHSAQFMTAMHRPWAPEHVEEMGYVKGEDSDGFRYFRTW